MKQNPTFADLSLLERSLLLLLAICGLLYLTGLVAGVVQWNILRRIDVEGGVSLDEAQLSDGFYALVGLLQGAFMLVTAVVWLFWLRRSYKSLQGIGTGTTDRTPGAAIGSWFIPFANIVRPYQIMRELWLRSKVKNESNYVEPADAPVILRVWWGVWLVLVTLERMAIRSAFRPNSSLSVESATATWLVLDVLGLIAATLAIMIVYRIAGFQSDWELAADTALVPSQTELRADYSS